jgi:hypothetical protein
MEAACFSETSVSEIHGDTTKKTVLSVVTTVEISNPMEQIFLRLFPLLIDIPLLLFTHLSPPPEVGGSSFLTYT